MDYLEISAARHGFSTITLPFFWPYRQINTIDKFKILSNLLKTGQISFDHVVLFTDAYDVIVVDNISTILAKFFTFDADIVFNAEANLYPENRDYVRNFFDLQNSKWRYLNSGCFIGFAWAINEMIENLLNSQSVSDPTAHWADQALVQDFFIENAASNRLKIHLDMDCSIFGTLFLSEDDFVFNKHGIRNVITGNNCSIIHANGDKNNLKFLEFYVEIIRSSNVYLLYDIRFCKNADEILSYDFKNRQLTWTHEVTDQSLIFLVRGNRRAVVTTVSGKILTFCPDMSVHCDREAIDIWEIIDIMGEIRSYHGADLGDYIHPNKTHALVLSPVTIGFISKVLNGENAAFIHKCYSLFR